MSPPVDEAERLKRLAEYEILDTPPDADLDELVALASAVCGTPIALISLVDESRQWFKAKFGLDAQETARNIAFCSHAIDADDELFTVPDARRDHRFSHNPLVTGDPNIVFYAGAPLVVAGGAKLGTLCVADREPRELTPLQQQTLTALAKVVVRHLELLRSLAAQKTAEARSKKLAAEAEEARGVAERANRSMDAFLANVSHELRTPLNAMLGWTRLLRSGTVTEAQRPKALETIERNATAQAQLIEDLLDVSRIVSGNMRVEPTPIDLIVVLEDALDVVRPAADAKHIVLKSIVDTKGHVVMGDAARLQQVIWNLLANAVKFAATVVEVRLSRVDDAVQLSVVDDGVGMTPAFLPNVFDRFRQAEDASTRSKGGLGLGLAIVRNLVELHGGTVTAESAGIGRGASFVVRLPLVKQMSLPPSKSERHQDSMTNLGSALEGVKVVIVDDEPDARELLAALLERCGAKVESAGSVAEAVERIATTSPDVVVSDIAMPGEDGYSLIGRIRGELGRPRGRLPVVALTAYARAEDRTRALRAGFDMHLPKPVEATELVAVITSLLDRR